MTLTGTVPHVQKRTREVLRAGDTNAAHKVATILQVVTQAFTEMSTGPHKKENYSVRKPHVKGRFRLRIRKPCST